MLSPVPFPARSRLVVPVQFWTVAVVAVSLIVCLAMYGLHLHQEETMRRSQRLLTHLREARLDLARGFLQLNLAEEPNSAVRREGGVALLERATVTLKAAELELLPTIQLGPEEAGWVATFQARAAAFREQLAAYHRAGADVRPGLKSSLGVAFNELDELAQRVDLLLQGALQALGRRLDVGFATALVGSVVLLGVICLGTYRVGRRQHLAEAALRRSETRLRNMGDNLPGGALYQLLMPPDGQHRFTYVSAGFEPIFGLSPDRILAEPQAFWELVHEEDRPRLVAEEQRCALALAVFDLEFRQRTATGEVKWIHARSTPRRLDDGSLLWDGVVADITARKQAEADLRESEARLRFALETSRTGAWDLDLVDHTAFRSREHDRIFGYAELLPAWTYEMFLEHVLPEDRARVDAQFQRAVATQGDWDFECRIRRVDGVVRWIWAAGRHRVDVGGKARRMAGVVQDITARQEADAELRRSEERFRTLVEQAPEGIFIQTRRRFAYLNAAALRIFGASRPEQLLGTLVEDHMHPDYRERVRERIRGLNEDRRPMPAMDQVFLRLDGSACDVSVSGVPFTFDHEPGALVFVRDIAERKQSEAALRESEARRTLALDAAQAGTWEWDLVNGRNVWSEKLWELYGLAPHSCEPSYQAWRATLEPEQRELVEQQLQSLVEQGAELSLEWQVREAGGRGRWLLSRGRPVRDDAGRVVRYLGVVMDITERKQAEAILRESERRFRLLLEASPVAMVFVGADERIGLLNRRFTQLFGYDATDLRTLADWWRQAYPDETYRAEVMAGWRAALEAPGRAGIPDTPRERRVMCKDGTLRLVEFTSIVLPEGVLVSLLDLTERKQAEAELVRARNTLLEAQRIAHLGSFEYIAATRRTVWSEEEYRIYGLDPDGPSPSYDEMLARCIHPDDAARLDAAFTQAMEQHAVYELEHRLIRPDGSVRWVHDRARPYLDADGRRVRYVGTTLDITERKRAEEDLHRLNAELEQRVGQRTAALSAEIALRQAREVQLQQLWRAVEQSPAGVMITDAQATVEYVNPQFERESGYTAAEVIGRNPRLLQSGAHSPEFFAEMWRALREGHTWRGELCNKRKDGSLYWELASIAPVCDPTGRTTHYVGIKENITERRKVAEELRQAKDQAEAANRAKSVFLANMSHEIRTPMNAILGFAQLLLRDEHASPGQRRRLEGIRHSGEHLLQIINEILEMARIEAGQLTLNPATCDLSRMLGELEEIFRLRAQNQGIGFQVEGDAEWCGEVRADETKLRQVLINLLGNAFKFTPVGGRITLRVRLTRNETERVELVAEVADTGRGMDPGELTQIFQPFHQTDAGRSAGGTGLGLAISRQFARLMGGDVTVESALGRGSRFVFTATVQAVAMPVDAAPLPPGRVIGLAPDAVGCRVLVVDDQADNREVVVGMLAPLGFALRTAKNGREALAQCEAWTPRVVILDLRMPELDGFETARRLRAAHATEPKIIALSASVAAEFREQALAAGADAFLGKPFQEEALLETITAVAGVEFIRNDPAGPASAATEADLPSVEALCRLPAEWRGALRRAAILADQQELLARVAEAAARDEVLGRQLRRLVERFETEALLRLLEKTSFPGDP